MATTNVPEGWSVPLHASLVQPQLILGMPRGFAILMMMGVLIITMPMNLWYIGIPLGFVLWILGAALTKWDEQWFDAGMRHIRQPSVYETL